MGCASSKKRTTSVDDLTADKKDSVASSKKKNGQISNDAKHKGGGDASKAIQIPGAHTSFMAPDGIPFIDEDVDEDAGTAVVRNATAASKPDVNRNLVQTAAAEKSTDDDKKKEIVDEIMKREIEMTQNTTTTTTGMYNIYTSRRHGCLIVSRVSLGWLIRDQVGIHIPTSVIIICCKRN